MCTKGVARIFQRGGHIVSKQGLFNYGQDIVMAFSLPVVGCLVKKGSQKGGSRAPQDPPGYALVVYNLKTSIDTKTESLPIFGWIMCTIGGLVSAKYWSSIGQVLVKCRPSIGSFTNYIAQMK